MGTLSAQLLKRLLPNGSTKADLVAGASAGAFIAGGYAAGLSVDEIVNLYQQHLKKIFDDSYWDDIKDLGKLLGADYDYTNLKKILKNIVGSRTLGELDTHLLIPAFDLDNQGEPRHWKPKFYNTFQDKDELLVDVMIRGAMAPTYFPVYQGFADGGLAANTPIMCAVAQALDTKTGKQKLEDICVLSIGAGFTPTYISGTKLDWGLSQWGPNLVPVITDSMKFVNEYQASRILGDNFTRIDPFLSKHIELDDTTQVSYLLEFADSVDISSSEEWIKNKWK